MKAKSFLVAFAMILSMQMAFSQSDSVMHSLGGSIGTPSIRTGISYQAKFQNHFAILMELNVGFFELFLETPHQTYTENHRDRSKSHYGYDYEWDWNLSLLSSTLHTLFLYNSLSGKQYDWYAGGGPAVGMQGVFLGSRDLTAGISFCVGFEWHSRKVPLDVGFDFRPTAALYFDTLHDEKSRVYPSGIFLFPLTVSLRGRLEHKK